MRTQVKADRDLILVNLRKDDPEIDYRIKNDTDRYRKGFGKIILETEDGGKVENARLSIKQVSHEFLFGCNMFMIDQFDSDERNKAYEEAFKKVFNLAVVPLYWSDLEPEQDKPRFGKDSVPVYRRPPVDRCLEFCESAGIIPKGHPLIWRLFYPQWLPDDPGQVRVLMEKRVREIAERYRDRIRMWDVCNEALSCRYNHPIRQVGDHLDLAFDLAEKYLPVSSDFAYNEDAPNSWLSFRKEQMPLYMLLKDLKKQHKLDAAGLQFHLFDRLVGTVEDYRNHLLNPRYLYEVMDWYARLGLPLKISEITLPGYAMVDDGEEFQAELLDRLYRIWFSHPAVHEITWWNLPDGTSARAPKKLNPGKDYFQGLIQGGLVNHDISPKQAYRVLERLVHEEWHSETDIDYVRNGPNMFHGFYGEYDITVASAVGTVTRRVHLGKDNRNQFTLKI